MQVSLLILFHFFHNFNKSPSLVLGQRSCFHNSYFIADLTFIVFIVSFNLLSSLYCFSVKGMSYEVFDCNNYSLIHLIGYNNTDFSFSSISFNCHSTSSFLLSL